MSPPRDFGDTSPDFVYVTAPSALSHTGDEPLGAWSSQPSQAPRIPRMTIAPEVQHAKAPGRLRRALAKVWRQMAGAK